MITWVNNHSSVQKMMQHIKWSHKKGMPELSFKYYDPHLHNYGPPPAEMDNQYQPVPSYHPGRANHHQSPKIMCTQWID